MPVASRPSSLGAVLALGVVALLGMSDFREDEIECEHAMAHLADCCPDLEVGADVCDYSSGCGDAAYPVLSVEQSECIQDRRCLEIEQSDLCAKVEALVRPRDPEPDAGSAAPPEHAEGCP